MTFDVENVALYAVLPRVHDIRHTAVSGVLEGRTTTQQRLPLYGFISFGQKRIFIPSAAAAFASAFASVLAAAANCPRLGGCNNELVGFKSLHIPVWRQRQWQ